MAKTSGGLRGGADSAANRWAAGISNPDMRAEAETAAMLIASKLGISPASLPKIIEAQIKSGKNGATIANYRDYQPELISNAMGHSSVKVTETYFMKHTVERINEMNKGIISYIFTK